MKLFHKKIKFIFESNKYENLTNIKWLVKEFWKIIICNSN
jgi:hypothetical protein